MKVKESYLDLNTPTGVMRTYVYEPSNDRDIHAQYGGILLYSEIFQQTGPIKRLAQKFAGQGYIVMVPEIYHEHLSCGTILGYDEMGRDKGNEYKFKTRITTFDNDAKAVIKALLQYPACNGKLGTVGFCIGGHLSFRAAFNPEIKAACCFYPTDIHSSSLGEGRCDDSILRASDIRGELVMIFGRQDPHVPLEGRASIYQALTKAGTFFSWHEFNGEHAFMRDEGNRYDPSLAHQCLNLAYDLFRRYL
ncbi:MAG: clcD 3 [Chlamydiales bacterium]|jgi:carboxymethylenebutenolidase|nr:clcD 3 [Chlamydiales bacterium]